MFNSKCLCNMADGKWGCWGLPVACWAALGEEVDLVHRPALLCLSEHHPVPTFWGLVPFCSSRSTGRWKCIWPSIPSSTASFFVIGFSPLLFCLKAKHLRLRVTCVVTVVAEGLFPFDLVVFLPNWTWKAVKGYPQLLSFYKWLWPLKS